MTAPVSIVVGVDVGGPGKGFHAVALRQGQYWQRYHALEPSAMAAWCGHVGATAVGIDAPCGWSRQGGSRQAERDLAARGIHAFATPSRDRALARPFFGWMLNGEALYTQIRKQHSLYTGQRPITGPVCFETFPHAVACALAGRVVPARGKATLRRRLLHDYGLDISELTNIDWIDAALCALAAQHVVQGRHVSYGNRAEGYILVPEDV